MENMNKKLLLSLGIMVIGFSAGAQDHYHGPNYEISVYSGMETKSIGNSEFRTQTVSALARHFPDWTFSLDQQTGIFSHLYGPAREVEGQSMEEKARGLIVQLADFGLQPAHWVKVRDHAAPRAHYVDFVQEVKGREVLFSRLSFQFTLDGRILKVSNRSFGQNITEEYPRLNPGAILGSKDWKVDLDHVQVEEVEIDPQWVWFPVPTQNGYELRPVWPLIFRGSSGENPPVQLLHFIDGVSGLTLYRTNEVKTLDLHVKGSVYKQNVLSPATLEPLRNLEVIINTLPHVSDQDGFVSNPGASSSVTFNLKGPWSTVIDAPSNSTPSFSKTIFGTGNEVIFESPSNSLDGHINAFYHVNEVHAKMKERLPDFTSLDYSLPTRVDIGSGTCNAFYNGSSINFYAASGNCRSFAEIGDIVYHEYGHGIADHFYGAHGAGRMYNGALNEGYADIWGMMMTRDSILGRGAFNNNPNSSIRRYDINPKVYPQDIVGEVHGDGEIIAGAWWDFARNVHNYDTMARVFGDAYYDLADGPNGMEGRVFHQALIAALLADDDDHDINNGTPHFREILSAFAKHGIFLYGQSELVHQELEHQPAGQDIEVNAQLNLASPNIMSHLKLIYRSRDQGTWDTAVMVDQGSLQFKATIPGQPQGSIMEYFFLLEDTLSLSQVTFPTDFTTVPTLGQRSSLPYQFAVGVHLKQSFDFDNPVSDDWQIGTTNLESATSGNWIQAKPVQATYRPNGNFGGFVSQPGSDMSGDGMCMVTGNASHPNINYNMADVANGRTVLVTPAFDLTGYVNPIIEYYRWFSNDLGGSNRANDPWRVEIRHENSFIPRVVENTYKGEREWRRKIFAVDEHFPGARKGVEIRFIASDLIVPSASNNGQSNVEALVDNFFIYDGAPLSIEEASAPQRARIYPNPTKGLSFLEFPERVKGHFQLSDLSGKVLLQMELNPDQQRYEIFTGNLAAGIYLISIQTERSIQVDRLVVQ